MKLLHIVKFIFIVLIRLYQVTLSPFIGKQCNFYPTCSNYAILSITKYGIKKGIKMSAIRICKCNPTNKEFKHDEP